MKAQKTKAMANRRALVVFSGQTELAWLRLLRPGFRHCFVLLEFEGRGGEGDRGEKGWVLYNPLSNGVQIDVWSVSDETALRAWCKTHGFEVLETWVRPLSSELYGWRAYSCVEAVKRALRLSAPWVFTPWQLYKTIKNENKEKSPLHLEIDRI